MMDLVEISGTVMVITSTIDGNFIFVKTETGSIERFYDYLRQYEFIEAGTSGTFLIDGVTRWNACSEYWEAIPRILKFTEC